MSTATRDVRLYCSCGRTTLGRCDPAGFFRVDDPEWRFHSHDVDDRRSRLWHCGRRDHFQLTCRDADSVAPPPVPDPEHSKEHDA